MANKYTRFAELFPYVLSIMLIGITTSIWFSNMGFSWKTILFYLGTLFIIVVVSIVMTKIVVYLEEDDYK